MFTDMVGFTALTQSDEAQSLGVLERHNKLLRPVFPKFHGREVKTMGDSFLIEFDSALDATNCAVEIQRTLHDYNTSSRDGWKIVLRISVHLGDVVHKDGDVFGDAVNIASRLQPLADPEGVCISEQVYYQIMNKVPYPLVKLEPRELKGIRSPVDAYQVVMPWERPGAAPSEQTGKRRVAILPFANMSPDPADEYFADGMTEELIDRLAQVKEIEVIARTSVMTYKGEKKKASQMAHELGVGSLVEGSVRKAGNRVRVTAQLISGATEGHLWSSHYDGTLDDIFAVQSEIAEKVAKELKVHLLEADKKNIEKKPTDNSEAYSDFLRGRELLRGEQTETTLRQALTLFEKAVELDPSFARAHVGMAESHIALADLYETKETAHTAARSSLKRALELDPDLPEAHSSLANLLYNEDDLPGSEAEAMRALELNPNLPDPQRLLFEIAATKDDRDGMVSYMETAYRLDPIMPLNILLLGEAYIWTGRDQEALAHWEKTEPVSPAYTYRGLGDYYFGKGDLAKAREYHDKVKKILPTHPWVIWMGGALAAMSGDRENALLAIRKLEERVNLGPIVLNYMAYVYLSLGDLDSYFAQMDKALEARAQIQSYVMHSPILARAREDPRYQKLLERLKRQTGLAK
jgi:TolB-like protein